MIITHNGTILTNDGVVLNNIITSPSFTNTYSLDFDGVSDRVDVGTSLNLGINSTISLWVKRDNVGVVEVVLGEDSYAFDYLLLFNTDNSIFFRINTISLQFKRIDGAIRTIMNQTTSWVNVVVVRTGDSAELFLNGNSMQTISGFGVSVDTRFDIIGSKPDGSFATNALIDEVSAWNTNTINPSDIYNGGTPNNLTPLNPLAWYRMGDNGLYKDPQWLIPSNENKDKVSNYSMAFDGLDDDITCGDLSSLVDNKSKLSISFWVNVPDAFEVNRICGKYGEQLTKWIAVTCYEDKVSFVVSNIGSSLAYAQTSAVLSDNTWHHVVCVFDGTQATANDRIRIYVDNVDESLSYNGTLPTSTYDFTLDPTNPTWYVGQVGLQLGNNELRGKLNEYAIYSDVALTDLEVDEIYNGGVPNNLNSLSVTPDLWYRMGEEATFSGGVWTVPDQLGSNDGTSNGMLIDARVGESPNSENNALSFNMISGDRVPDTPPTP
jgi:hypothetical protein